MRARVRQDGATPRWSIVVALIPLAIAAMPLGAQTTSIWVSAGGAVGEVATFEIAQSAGSQPFIAYWSLADRYGAGTTVIVPAGFGQLNAQGRGSFTVAVPNVPAVEGVRLSVAAGNLLSYNMFLWPLAGPSTPVARPAGTIGPAAMDPTVVGLADGRFALTGGWNRTTQRPTRAVSIFDPRTNRLTPAGNLTAVRQGHVAAVLANGTVFVAGGGVSFPEIYDPRTGASAPLAGSLPPTSLDDCVIVRDAANPGEWAVVNRGRSVWAFDLATAAVSTFVSTLTSSGQAPVAIPRKPEYALVGGTRRSTPAETGAIEVWNLRTRQARVIGSVRPQANGRAIAVDRFLLVVGGMGRLATVSDVDVFDLTNRQPTPLPSLRVGRFRDFAIGLQTGGVIRVGGGTSYVAGIGALMEQVSATKATPLRPLPTIAAQTDFTFGPGGSALCVADADLFYLP